MRRLIFASVCAALLFIVPAGANATTISVVSGTTTLSSNTTTAGTNSSPWTITEGVNAGPVILEFANATGGAVLTYPSGTGTHASGDWFEKTVTNNTGIAWTSFEIELQSVFGVASTDGDGLSFAQGAGLSFTSDKFSTLTKLEITRDYLNFSGGTVLPGDLVTFHFAITDNSFNNPFWLVETPNKADVPVPEPASMLLLGSGLVGLAARIRRRK